MIIIINIIIANSFLCNLIVIMNAMDAITISIIIIIIIISVDDRHAYY